MKSSTFPLAAGLFALLLIVPCPDPLRGKERDPVKVQARFSPAGGTRKTIEGLLESAKTEVRIALYLFSSPQLAWKVVSTAKRGVDVEVLLDEEENKHKRWSMARTLEDNGVAVRYVKVRKRKGDPTHAKFHHKFAVVDRTTVVTGSFNWSNMADATNHENVVIIQSKSLAARFLKAYDKARAISHAR